MNITCYTSAICVVVKEVIEFQKLPSESKPNTPHQVGKLEQSLPRSSNLALHSAALYFLKIPQSL